MSDIIPMSQTCSNCGAVAVNDDPAIKHPLEFLDALRKKGWHIPLTQVGHLPTSGIKPPACPKCAFS